MPGSRDPIAPLKDDAIAGLTLFLDPRLPNFLKRHGRLDRY
jgi:hypothetical protein